MEILFFDCSEVILIFGLATGTDLQISQSRLRRVRNTPAAAAAAAPAGNTDQRIEALRHNTTSNPCQLSLLSGTPHTRPQIESHEGWCMQHGLSKHYLKTLAVARKETCFASVFYVCLCLGSPLPVVEPWEQWLFIPRCISELTMVSRCAATFRMLAALTRPSS